MKIVYDKITKRIKAFGACDFTQPNWDGQPLCGVDDIQIESPLMILPDESIFCVIDDSTNPPGISVDEVYKAQVLIEREKEIEKEQKKEIKREIIDLEIKKDKAIELGYDDVAADLQAQIDGLKEKIK